MGSAALDDSLAFRRALGCFATGVCLVTAADEGGATAIVVNSFTSVSLHPRLVLWCLDERSDRYAVFAKAEHWGITVLAADQQEVSAAFAKPGANRIDAEALTRWGDAPVLNRGLARFGCRTHQRLTVGDHLVIVGEVQMFAADPGPGLTYFKGRYGHAAEPLT